MVMPEITRRQILAGAAATTAVATMPAAVIASSPRRQRFRTVADIVRDVAAGRMGTRAAIEALELNTHDQLVECLRLNGYSTPLKTGQHPSSS
jgi:hypothetical protein